MRRLVAVVWLLSCSSYAVEWSDFSGRSIDLPGRRPSRIVTLTPAIAEIVADLLPGEISRIVGVSEHTDRPTELAATWSQLPSIGPYHRINLERVVALKPDLVIATRDGNPEDQVMRLRELGILVVVISHRTIDELLKSVLLMSRSLAAEKNGIRLVAQFQREMKMLRGRFSAKNTVMVQIGDDPIIVAGNHSLIGEGLNWLGVTNAAPRSPEPYPKLNREVFLKTDPEWIVLCPMTPGLAEQLQKKWKNQSRLRAVKSGNVRILPSDALLRPSLRWVIGLRNLQKVLEK